MTEQAAIAAASKKATESFDSYGENIRKLWEYRKELLNLSIELFNIKGNQSFSLDFRVTEAGERFVAFEILNNTGYLFLSGNQDKEPGSYSLDRQSSEYPTESGSIDNWIKSVIPKLDGFSRFAAKNYSNLLLASNIAEKYPTVEVAQTILEELKQFKEELKQNQ